MGERSVDERPELLLHYFLGALSTMDPQAAWRMRDELMNRFGGRYCNHELCAKMVELLNGHLAAMQAQAAQHRFTSEVVGSQERRSA